MVLNLTPNPPRAYRVNIKDMDCTCPDHSYNTEEAETCKHLSYALFQAPESVGVEQELVNDLSLVLSDLHETVASLDGKAETNGTMEASEAMETDPSEATDEATEDTEVQMTTAADKVEDWIEATTTAPEHVDVYIGNHGPDSGIILEPDNGEMKDHQYEAFKGVVGSIEESTVHVGFADDPCSHCGDQDDEFYYHIPGSAAMEVGEDG
jgi:uncharacterized Zn finger protein